jgi:MinD superfamily P-loop ATPase
MVTSGRLPPEVIKEIHKKDFKTPVICVTGGKGGVGKTTVSVNLAEALVNMGYRVALTDADVDAPDAAILLGLTLDNPVDVFITMPLIDESQCNACGDCVKACTRNALFLPKGMTPILMGECNGCEACLMACPSNAIYRIRYDISVPKAIGQAMPVVAAYPDAPASLVLRELADRLKDFLI